MHNKRRTFKKKNYNLKILNLLGLNFKQELPFFLKVNYNYNQGST